MTLAFPSASITSIQWANRSYGAMKEGPKTHTNIGLLDVATHAFSRCSQKTSMELRTRAGIAADYIGGANAVDGNKTTILSRRINGSVARKEAPRVSIAK